MIQVHGTCVEVGGSGVLLRGASGSGKSDLALRLIDGGAFLVADDRVDLRILRGALIATAPEPIAGQMEVRGIGIVSVPTVDQARLTLVIDLVPPEMVERLPEPSACAFLDVRVPLVQLAAFEASAAAKIRLAVNSFGQTLSPTAL